MPSAMPTHWVELQGAARGHIEITGSVAVVAPVMGAMIDILPWPVRVSEER